MSQKNGPIKMTIVCGSHREQSESYRVGQIVQNFLTQKKEDNLVEVDILNLGGNPLPLWDEDFWSDSPKWSSLWGSISQRLVASDGFIIISPEWGGMVPAGLKNFFLLCSGEELAHKPAYIITVSAGPNGAYPVAELRMSSYKNNKICYIPEHLIVRKAGDFMVNPEQPSEKDCRLLKRLDYGLDMLLAYAKQLYFIREKMKKGDQEYPYGM